MNHVLKLTAASLLLILSACSSSPEPLEISQTEEIEATVTAVDVESRVLVLQGPAGNSAIFRVGPEVRNLAQVQVGDTLRVTYYTGYLISMAEPGHAGADTEIAAGRTAEGERPGAVVGASTRATVEIVSIADDGTAVSFRTVDGFLQSIDVKREDSREFARKLRPGDLVDISYSEAFAVSIEATE
jgi:hypothetical protein